MSGEISRAEEGMPAMDLVLLSCTGNLVGNLFFILMDLNSFSELMTTPVIHPKV